MHEENLLIKLRCKGALFNWLENIDERLFNVSCKIFLKIWLDFYWKILF